MLTSGEIAASAASIVAMQEPDGAIPWTTGEHTDVWNHLESAMAPSGSCIATIDAAEAAISPEVSTGVSSACGSRGPGSCR